MERQITKIFNSKRLLFSSLFVVLTTFSCVPTNSRPGEGEIFALRMMVEIRTLQKQYAGKHQGRFAPNFDELVKTENLDERFRGQKPVVKGYIFEMRVEEPTSQKPPFYSINADPHISEGFYKSGTGHYYLDSTLGIIKGAKENRPAKAEDPPI